MAYDYAELAINAVQQGQAQKEVTINAGLQAASQAAAVVTVAMVNGDNLLSLAQSRAAVLILTGALTAIAAVVLDSNVAKPTEILNLTTGGFAVSAKIGAGGTPVVVPNGAATGIKLFNAAGSSRSLGGSSGGSADFVYADDTTRRAANTLTTADIGKLARVTATGLLYRIASLKGASPNKANWYLVASSEADVITQDLNAVTASAGTHWTDGSFPSNIQPAYLITSSAGLLFWYDIPNVPAGTFDVYIDCAQSSNLSDVKSSDSGGTVNGNLLVGYDGVHSSTAVYNQLCGSVTQAALGTLRLYFKVITSRGFIILKNAYLRYQ